MAVTFTRANTAKGVTTAGITQNSITPAYTAASAGGSLLAIIQTQCTNSALTCTPPGGNWSSKGHVRNTGQGDGGYYDCFFFENDAVDGTTSAVFSFNNNVNVAAIVLEFGGTSGMDTTNIFSATSAAGASTTTGSGTAADAADWEVIGGYDEDAAYTPSAVTGFTNDLGLADHGDGGAGYASSFAVFHKTAINASTTIASNTITWTGAGGVGMGWTILMRPVLVTGRVVLPDYDGGLKMNLVGGMAA
jgi:hypothetical protein